MQTNNLVIHAINPGLTFRDQFRLKTAIPVTRNVDGHFAVIALEHFAGRAIAPVGLLTVGLTMRFISDCFEKLSYRALMPNL
tara:strand:+ start:42 stop:287 length:246 start_codon:yes stop_codon:yes gene_type:complete